MDLYGEFTPYRISWEVDRIGVHRIVMGLQYVGIPVMDTAPDPPRDILFVRAVDQPEDGGSHGVVQYYFEGATDADIDRAVPQYDFNGSYNQEPITSHPEILKLLKKYKGRLKDGRVDWPAYLTAGGGSSVALGGGGTKSSDVNPLYGVDSYLDFGAVWTETRMYKELPGFLWEGVGEIFANVPGGAPTPNGRNWLKLAPVGRQRGNVTEVNFPYLLSGRRGWVEPVYNGSIV